MKLPTSSNKKKSFELTSYTSEVRKVLRREFAEERTRLAGGCCKFQVRDGANFENELTFNIDLDSLPTALEQDRVVVLFNEEKCVARGFICRINAISKQVKIILNEKPQIPEEAKPKEGEDFVRFEVCFNLGHYKSRAHTIKAAIESLNSARLSPHILNSLLSCYEERNNTKFIKARALNLAGAPPLSKKQKLAVEQALMKRISLVEGVQGSGKTLVAANIAYSMSRTHRERRKVLICSPLQSTVNLLARILASATGYSGQVVQLTPELLTDRAKKGSYDRRIGLSESVREKLKHRWQHKLFRHTDLLSSTLNNRRVHLSDFRKWKLERKLLDEADIVCCTLEQSLSDCLRGVPFKALIIDDAQYASEYECLLAISSTSDSLKQVTLLGDMRRSERMIFYSMGSAARPQDKSPYQRRSSFIADSRLRRKLEANGLNQEALAAQTSRQSLFDRWLERGLPSVVLKLRYRKLNKLDTFLRRCTMSFEHNGSSSVKSIDRRVSSIEQPTPSTSNGYKPQTDTPQTKRWTILPTDDSSWLPGCPVLFDINSSALVGTAKKLIEHIARWTNDAPVCIITNYGQGSDLDDIDKSVERGCASDYLGQQRDYVILLCRKSAPGEHEKIRRKARIENDFLVHNEALMIALTRASRGLFILTDLEETIPDETGIMERSVAVGDAWKSLVGYCREEDLIMEQYPGAN